MKLKFKYIALLPISVLYGLATAVRNWLFDHEILQSARFNIPIVSVGNLSVGGTGKTPHTELILSALQAKWKIAVLSRGYMRKTSGFYFADENTNSLIVGDEPYQIHRKFPEIAVAVHERRVSGVNRLLEIVPDLQLIVLDDAYQHRYIQPGLSILLTDYSNLYTRDLPLPGGSLREWKSGSKRADMVIVTKCPTNLNPIEMRVIETELKPENNQALFFSSYVYDGIKPVFPDSEPDNWTFGKIKQTNAGVLLVAGIASPVAIINQLQAYTDHITKVIFPDHHAFLLKDYNLIINRFESVNSDEKIILVTEKDAARMVSDVNFPESLKSKIFFLPIQVKILNNQESQFIQKIQNYVVENSRNS